MNSTENNILLGMSPEELRMVCDTLGLPAFTAKQLANWLYVKRVETFEEMTNLSLSARAKLNEAYVVGRKEPVMVQESADGTRKYLFAAAKGATVETVMIPDKERMTLCVSSQVGCKMDCLFCQTGKQGFGGQLRVDEILNQLLSVEESDELTNVVFMGMGEPLDNYEPLVRAIRVMTAEWGWAWSPKRITVSTVGVVPTLKRLLDETQVHVAISVHSPFSEERRQLMPIEKVYPVEEVIRLLKEYDFRGQRRCSVEYILFDNMNDTDEHARGLIALLRGLEARVNLIRFHAVPGVRLVTSKERRIAEFRDLLSRKGVLCTVRSSRGEDIAAACGMLSSKERSVRK